MSSDRPASRPVLLDMMLERLGLSEAASREESVGMLVHRVAESCRACPKPKSCEEWLARGDELEANAYNGFCPNAARLDKLRGG